MVCRETQRYGGARSLTSLAELAFAAACCVPAAFGSLVPPRPALDQNPACWTDGHSYERCCGEAGPAPGCFGDDDLLGPHARARCCSSPCGAALRSRIERGGLRRCAAKEHRNATIVTGLWNLGRERWASHVRYKEGSERAYARYLTWLDRLLQKREAILLFVDSEAAAFAAERRKAYGLQRLTCIMEVPQEDLPQMRHRDAYLAAHEENRRQLPWDTQPEVVRADYTLVVNSKPELLACAALWDPFRSSSFAWVDAGSGRKEGFPQGAAPLSLPPCAPWALCVGRRMWLFFDFRSKLKRLEHGSTFDTTVLLGGHEGVWMYALWFQWAIAQYLAEGVMDDEQSIIAEVWWLGQFRIQSYFGMHWQDTLSQMLQASDMGVLRARLASVDYAWRMGHWFGGHPQLVWQNDGNLWVPFAHNLSVVQEVPVNKLSDDHLERIAYALWCMSRQFGYYERYCRAYDRSHQQTDYDGFEDLPIVLAGNRMAIPVHSKGTTPS